MRIDKRTVWDYDKKGLLDDAVRSYKKAIEIDSKYIRARNNLGNLYLRMGMNKKAEMEFKRILEITPDSSSAQENYRKAIGAVK